jgi:hypothetical protein
MSMTAGVPVAARAALGREQADEDVVAYWQHLPRATLTHDATVLKLYDGTFFFGSEDFGDKLYIRDYWFAEIESRMIKHFASGGKGMAIIGNPGDD